MKIPICKHCGSSDVLFDAYARFDADLGEMVLESSFDQTICMSEACDGGECSIIEVDRNRLGDITRCGICDTISMDSKCSACESLDQEAR